MSSSELASYSPISSLERQYASVISAPPSSNSNSNINSNINSNSNSPTQQRLFLFAALNANCCLAAGVETILQHKKGLPSLESNQPNHVYPANDNNNNNNNNNNNIDGGIGCGAGDPFSFLHDNPTLINNNNTNNRSAINPRSASSSSSAAAAGPKLGNFFKKVAQHTTQTLERSVQGLAIRADKGKSPDWLVLALYDATTGRLISCTEPQAVPTREEERLQGLVFHIPLWQMMLPTSSSVVTTLKLWIQSGATLLGAKVAKQYYLLGQVSNVTLTLPNHSSSVFATPTSSYLLQSNFIVNGQVQLLVSHDLKWPIPYAPGWSLVHPNYRSYALYHPPLDQSYAYRGNFNAKATLLSPTATLVSSSSFSSSLWTWCIATERAIESTLILPVAASVMSLAHEASLVSLQHATHVVQQTMATARHDQPPSVLTANTKASCQLYMYHTIQVAASTTATTTTTTTTPPSSYRRSNSSASSGSGGGSGGGASYYVRVSWQRPDCIFELELLPLTALTVTPNNTTSPTIHLPFFPKLCWTMNSNSPESNRSSSTFVPGVLSLWEQSSSQQPLPPFLLGSLRVEVVVSRGSSMSNIGNPFDPIGTTAAAVVGSPNDDREVWQNVIALEPYAKTVAAAGAANPTNTSTTAATTTTTSGASSSNITALCVRLFHTKTGQVMGSINMHLQVAVPTTVSPSSPLESLNNTSTTPSAKNGLVAVMGLDNLADEIPGWKCPQPMVDYDDDDHVGESTTFRLDLQQQYSLAASSASFGTFMTSPYLQQHITLVRTSDVQRFQHIAQSYRAALSGGAVAAGNSSLVVPAHLDRSPKPFRPSSSRSEDLLSAIPFNVHVQSLDVTMVPPPNATTPPPAALAATIPSAGSAMFHNITCGAPADHARGFGNVFKNNSSSGINAKDASSSSSASSMVITCPIGSVAGGLRRLEAKRIELAQLVQRHQAALAVAVATYQAAYRRQQAQAQQQQQQKTQEVPPQQHLPPVYIPARHFDLSHARWKVFEAVHALHHVTWQCAVRRSHCFSQALGVALSSYLTSVSNSGNSAGWPQVWVRHGYLITFEGLLSAAGKELGMIEDASVAIAMLRQVSVVMVPVEDPVAWRQQQQQLQQHPLQARPGLVEIPESPHLIYLHLTATTSTSPIQYRVELGLDANYYRQQLPEALKHGTAVTLYPLLFQVGVDIRQWGANAGNQVKNQLSNAGSVDTVGCNSNTTTTTTPPSSNQSLFFDDDADDDAGVADDDVLVQLNYEALRKLNGYAHALYPQTTTAVPVATAASSVATGALADLLDTDTLPSPPPQQQQIHPFLTMLHGHILSSAGRMNHSILDEAATIGQQLGGGGVVFCKSGKDRTAMQVTYKQAQFVNRFLKAPDSRTTTTTTGTDNNTLQDAALMRIHGTRLPICEKNVGHGKYAFNSLQVQFMPEALKPPPNTLAGFLKGGRIFGKGGIES